MEKYVTAIPSISPRHRQSRLASVRLLLIRPDILQALESIRIRFDFTGMDANLDSAHKVNLTPRPLAHARSTHTSYAKHTHAGELAAQEVGSVCDYAHISRYLGLRSTFLRRHTSIRTLPNTSHEPHHTHSTRTFLQIRPPNRNTHTPHAHFLTQAYIQKLITDSGDWLQKTVKLRRLSILKVPRTTTLN
jgi:hypothetical protein